ncbi:hypothetical protein E0L29_07260 [Chlorobium sp. N1]|nr:hypothetical protein [Chlorobium sp. N1]TCD47687.1 hypothetical protein E0L29_07260 [Chlorobium sp. N1]
MECGNEREARYRALVEGIVEEWAAGKPPNPRAADPNAKPSGYWRLTGWLTNYLLRHDEFPRGVHPMPEGRDSEGRLEPSFPVDFDRLLGERPFPASR